MTVYDAPKDVELGTLTGDVAEISGPSSPVPHHSITWSDISWDVNLKNSFGKATGETKKILNSVTGVLHSSG